LKKTIVLHRTVKNANRSEYYEFNCNCKKLIADQRGNAKAEREKEFQQINEQRITDKANKKGQLNAMSAWGVQSKGKIIIRTYCNSVDRR
jgi:hypothetical protein